MYLTCMSSSLKYGIQACHILVCLTSVFGDLYPNIRLFVNNQGKNGLSVVVGDRFVGSLDGRVLTLRCASLTRRSVILIISLI